ncbi:MAG: hypothetical protein Q9226_009011 [Calogaya cf. arnoldii]
MLPEFLAGSYKRYKQDTALFTTWLAKAASSVGYNPNGTRQQQSQQPDFLEAEPIQVAVPSQAAVPKGPRLKGKARKAAKDAAGKDSAGKSEEPNNGHSESQALPRVKYNITTGEVLRQAEAVAKSYLTCDVKMPASLQMVVERAVRARQRCSEWFQKSGVSNQYADKQHTHFIGVPEQSLEILKPCMESEPAGPQQQNRDEPSLERNSVTNRFSSLKIEETPDIDPTEVSEVAAAINVPAKTKASESELEIAVYELEDEDEFDEELAFIIFCFFEDLHRTQDFINELWRKYKARKCDVHIAAITTNAAFDLVRQAEEDLIAQAPAVFDSKRSYDSIAIIQGIDPEARLKSNQSLQATPFDDFIYLSTARILMKFTFIADLPPGCDLPYPAPCPPLRFSYISRPELLGTPEMNRKEEEDSMLSQLIIDRQLWNTCKQEGFPGRSPPPPEDELSESLDRLTKQGILSAALVFEARIYLDIREIMGDDIGRGHQDLLRNTKTIDKDYES